MKNRWTRWMMSLGVGLMMAIPAQAQVSTPDTVCAGASGVQYFTTNTVGSTYLWVVLGGTIASGQGTNAITVNWGNVGVNGVVKLLETSSLLCPGDTQLLNVLVRPLPTAILSGSPTICQGDSALITVNFTGTGPWNLTYSDGTTSTNLTGITTSTLNINTGALNSGKTYSLSTVTDAFCGSTGTGSATVTVNSKPASGGIFHY